MAGNTNEQTSKSTEATNKAVEKAKEDNEQEKINQALRQKYEREMKIFETQSNQILDEVRAKGVSTSSSNDKKKLPEMITDIHILFSRQNPKFVKEGEDTSKKLEKELNGTLEDKIKEESSKKKDEDKNSDETSDGK